MNSPERLPRRYWGRILCIGLLMVLLFALIGLTVFMTDGRSIGQFRRTDWQIFSAFLLSAAVTLLGAFAIARSAGALLTEQRRQQFLAHLHEGIDPADSFCILPELDGDRRALITRADSGFHLVLEEHDGQQWQHCISSSTSLPDVAAILAFLEDEHGFFCDPEDLPAPTE